MTEILVHGSLTIYFYCPKCKRHLKQEVDKNFFDNLEIRCGRCKAELIWEQKVSLKKG